MESEFLFLLAFLVFVWLPVTVVFLRNHRPAAVKVGKTKAYRLNRRYRRHFMPGERKMQEQACRLLSEIDDALKFNQRIQSDRKSSLKAQKRVKFRFDPPERILRVIRWFYLCVLGVTAILWGFSVSQFLDPFNGFQFLEVLVPLTVIF